MNAFDCCRKSVPHRDKSHETFKPSFRNSGAHFNFRVLNSLYPYPPPSLRPKIEVRSRALLEKEARAGAEIRKRERVVLALWRVPRIAWKFVCRDGGSCGVKCSFSTKSVSRAQSRKQEVSFDHLSRSPHPILLQRAFSERAVMSLSYIRSAKLAVTSIRL